MYKVRPIRGQMLYTLVFGFIALWVITSLFREFYVWHLTKKLTETKERLKKVKKNPMFEMRDGMGRMLDEYEITKRGHYDIYHTDITSYNAKIAIIRKCSMKTLVAYMLVNLCEFILPRAKTMIE